MLVLLNNNHTIYQVYLIEKDGDEYKIWIEGQENPIYEKIANVQLVCK